MNFQRNTQILKIFKEKYMNVYENEICMYIFNHIYQLNFCQPEAQGAILLLFTLFNSFFSYFSFHFSFIFVLCLGFSYFYYYLYSSFFC